MDSSNEENDVTPPGRCFDSPTVETLQQCEHHTRSGLNNSSENIEHGVDDVACTSADHEYMDDNPPRPNIVCAISELRDQQPNTTTLTSADFKVLDELTEELLVASVRRSLKLPPVSLSPHNEQSSSSSRADSIASSSDMKKWLIMPSVLDKLLELGEASSEIRHPKTDYGKHLPPLPSCFSSVPKKLKKKRKRKHLPPIITHTEESNYVAPDHFSDKVQILPTTDNQRPSEADSEPVVLEVKKPILSEKFRKFQTFYSELIEEDSKCLPEHLSPVTQHFKKEVTEQIDTPVQLLDVPADDNVIVPYETVESTAIESVAVAKSDGDGLELNEKATVKSAAAASPEQPRQGHRRSLMSALGRRLLKVVRMCCCFCCPNNI